MLSHKERIPRTLFHTLSSPKRVVGTPALSLRVFRLPNGVSGPRFMLTMAKKEAKTATTRNKMRRRYAHILHAIPLNKTPEGFQLIIKKGALHLSAKEAKEETQRLFQSLAV